MRKTFTVSVFLALFALFASACGPNPAIPPAVGSLVPTAKAIGSLLPTAEAAGSLVPTAESLATQIASTLAASTPGAGLAAEVDVLDFPPLGPILVDGDDHTLYIFKGDTPNSGTSTCDTSECLTNWTPLITGANPVAGEGVDASMLGTIQLSSGLMQVTYNGWPLYHFMGEGKPGAANGQGVKDQWFVIGPDGVPITTALTAPGATTGAATEPAVTATATP